MPSHFFSGIVFPYIKDAEEPGYCQTYLNANQKRKFCEQYSVLRKNGKATPVVFEHEDERVIGDIVSYYVDDKENLCVVGRLEDATYAKQLMQQNGKIGLSLKMNHVGAPVMEGGQVAKIGIKEKDLVHVGIVSEPAFEESLVEVFTEDADHMANTYKTYADKGFYVSQYDKEQYFSNKESLSSPAPTPTPSFEVSLFRNLFFIFCFRSRNTVAAGVKNFINRSINYLIRSLLFLFCLDGRIARRSLPIVHYSSKQIREYGP